MFERFTEGAIKVMMVSQEEARRMGHNFVGTEQMLLGVIGQKHGIGARALRYCGVNLRKARKEIELYIGRGSGFISSDLPFTPRAKRVKIKEQMNNISYILIQIYTYKLRLE